MATATFIHDGGGIDYTPASNVAAGDVVVQMDLVGVARRDIPANTPGSLAVTGVFDVLKLTGPGMYFDPGQIVYWDSVARKASNIANGGSNKIMGKAIRGTGMGESIVRVRLNQ
jgi:predicted RecA/RadA family phage recombinase